MEDKNRPASASGTSSTASSTAASALPTSSKEENITEEPKRDICASSVRNDKESNDASKPNAKVEVAGGSEATGSEKAKEGEQKSQGSRAKAGGVVNGNIDYSPSDRV